MLSLLSAAALAASPSAGQDSRASLIAFADAFDRAQITKDTAALEEMVSDDLIFIEGSAARSNKKGFIAGWSGPGDSYQPINLIDRTVTMLGEDAGIVGAEVTLQGVSDGNPFSRRFRFSDTFRRTGGRWQAVYIQVTYFPPSEQP